MFFLRLLPLRTSLCYTTFYQRKPKEDPKYRTLSGPGSALASFGLMAAASVTSLSLAVLNHLLNTS